ncbi:hypothetical protein LEN26_019376 [Aphanomyces euteiches]|nr:hypothetical protein LEN26_019376 [Aphanomyces euteiches]
MRAAIVDAILLICFAVACVADVKKTHFEDSQFTHAVRQALAATGVASLGHMPMLETPWRRYMDAVRECASTLYNRNTRRLVFLNPSLAPSEQCTPSLNLATLNLEAAMRDFVDDDQFRDVLRSIPAAGITKDRVADLQWPAGQSSIVVSVRGIDADASNEWTLNTNAKWILFRRPSLSFSPNGNPQSASVTVERKTRTGTFASVQQSLFNDQDWLLFAGDNSGEDWSLRFTWTRDLLSSSIADRFFILPLALPVENALDPVVARQLATDADKQAVSPSTKDPLDAGNKTLPPPSTPSPTRNTTTETPVTTPSTTETTEKPPTSSPATSNPTPTNPKTSPPTQNPPPSPSPVNPPPLTTLGVTTPSPTANSVEEPPTSTETTNAPDLTMPDVSTSNPTQTKVSRSPKPPPNDGDGSGKSPNEPGGYPVVPPSTSKNEKFTMWYIIGGSGLGIVAIVATFCLWIYKHRRSATSVHDVVANEEDVQEYYMASRRDSLPRKRSRVASIEMAPHNKPPLQQRRRSSGAAAPPLALPIKEDVAKREDDQLGDLDLSFLHVHRIPAADIKIIESVAVGAFGEILTARYENKLVGVKRLLPSKKHQAVDVSKFLFEIKLLSTVESSYIVSFVGASWTRVSDMMLVMEWMDAGDLCTFLASKTRTTFPWRCKVQCAHDIAHALVYLHSMLPKVLHRDLKSRNVLLNTAMQTKVTDFGISRELDSYETRTLGVGTYRWMAPEVLQHGHYDTSADVYSLGVILTELDTHKMPFHDVKVKGGSAQIVTDMAIMAKVLAGEIAPQFSTTAPSWYVELGRKCMALDPTTRPTAMEVAYALKMELRNLAGEETTI